MTESFQKLLHAIEVLKSYEGYNFKINIVAWHKFGIASPPSIYAKSKLFYTNTHWFWVSYSEKLICLKF